MAQGKPAGVRCIQLDASNRCQLFGDPRRPAVCTSLQPSIEMCGSEQAHALRYWYDLAEFGVNDDRFARGGRLGVQGIHGEWFLSV